MSLWDVQRDSRTNQIIAIRPAGFKGWGRKDGLPPLVIKQEELGQNYFRLDAVSLSKNGNGIDKAEAELAKEAAIQDAIKEDVAAVTKVLTVADLEAEAIKRGYTLQPKATGKEI